VMTSAEAQAWQRSRSRGRTRFLAWKTLRGFVLFVLTSALFWWMGARREIPGEFVRRMTLIGLLAWVGGSLLFGALWWLLQERRYDRRMQAEAGREGPSTTGA
jgi:hypothetical protein